MGMHVHIVSIYHSLTKVKFSQFIEALNHLQTTRLVNQQAIIFGDFNVDFSKNSHEHKDLLSNMVQSKGLITNYHQLITNCTTDYQTQIDHIYTNIPRLIYTSGILESYYSDHKPIFACIRL